VYYQLPTFTCSEVIELSHFVRGQVAVETYVSLEEAISRAIDIELVENDLWYSQSIALYDFAYE